MILVPGAAAQHQVIFEGYLREGNGRGVGGMPGGAKKAEGLGEVVGMSRDKVHGRGIERLEKDAKSVDGFRGETVANTCSLPASIRFQDCFGNKDRRCTGEVLCGYILGTIHSFDGVSRISRSCWR